MKEQTSLKKSQICPTCHKQAVYDFRPFCSRRCADIDLGKWLSGTFVIQGLEDEDTSAESKQKILSSNIETTTDMDE